MAKIVSVVLVLFSLKVFAVHMLCEPIVGKADPMITGLEIILDDGNGFGGATISIKDLGPDKKFRENFQYSITFETESDEVDDTKLWYHNSDKSMKMRFDEAEQVWKFFGTTPKDSGIAPNYQLAGDFTCESLDEQPSQENNSRIDDPNKQ